MKTFTLFYPLGLMNLLDRFAFYGTRVMLVLYFVSEFGFSSEYAYEFYGAILALMYALPIMGGWIIDKGFDRSLALFLGIAIKIIGHGILIFAQSYFTLTCAFTAIILGHLVYKPSTLTLFSDFAEQLKQGKDKSFTVLFICLQFGAVFGILLCGFIAEKYGWRLGMALATLALIAQLVVFLTNRKEMAKMIGQISQKPLMKH